MKNSFTFKKLFSSLRRKKYAVVLWPVIGLASTLWFLIRVVPKPSRAGYPCMKVAAPLASTFAVYLICLLTSVIAFTRAKRYIKQSRYFLGAALVFVAMVGMMGMTSAPDTYTFAEIARDEPNQPVGEAKGIFPGRVVWSWNPDATRRECKNQSDDYWWMEKNNDLPTVESMLSETLQALTGQTSDEAAWDALFRHFNETHGKGDTGYQKGEDISIKINLGCEWSRNMDGNYNWRDNRKNNLKRCDGTPNVVLAVLRSLVNKAGVPQENIGIGDAIRNFGGPYWDLCHDEFPDVNYWGKKGDKGRTKISRSSSGKLYYSDGEDDDSLPENIVDTDYMINVPCLKAHARAGITIGAKNHFGSHMRNNAFHLHRSLPCPDQDGDYSNGVMGLYRCLVDIMGHEHLGGKTMLYIVDGIWGSNEAVDPPTKWKTAPFNNDWPNSLILSQDPVAVESFCFDLLYEEFDPVKYPKSAYPHMPGVQDYLHQAADPANWPDGIKYDPENDGTVLKSLGVHEHWNNATDKQYTRNLGTGDGIELVKIMHEPTAVENHTTDAVPAAFEMYQNYPNPFNPSTQIRFDLHRDARVQLSIYNVRGEKIATLMQQNMSAGTHQADWNGRKAAPSGVYFAKLSVTVDDGRFEQVKRMMLLK